MDITQMGILTPPLAVAFALSAVKPAIELRFPPGSKLHDGVIRGTAIVFGIVGVVADYINNASHITSIGLEQAAGSGAIAGAAAVVGYHLLTGDIFTTKTPPTTTPA